MLFPLLRLAFFVVKWRPCFCGGAECVAILLWLGVCVVPLDNCCFAECFLWMLNICPMGYYQITKINNNSNNYYFCPILHCIALGRWYLGKKCMRRTARNVSFFIYFFRLPFRFSEWLSFFCLLDLWSKNIL